MKKLLSLILTVFLSLFLLTACGTNQKPHTAPPAGAAYSSEKETGGITVKKDGTYTDKVHVAAYIHKYKTLPSNYITKKKRGNWAGKKKVPSTALPREKASAVTVSGTTKNFFLKKAAAHGKNVILTM